MKPPFLYKFIFELKLFFLTCECYKIPFRLNYINRMQ